MQDGGGIFGADAGDTSGVTSASNCYSSGTITTSGTGIFGSNKVTGTATNCYSANGSWNSSTANTNLQGIPSSTPGVGTVWAATAVNTAYELVNLGPTPYQTEVISGNALVQSKSQTVTPGEGTIEALSADASGNAFSILDKTGGDTDSYDTITISNQTGQISTTAATVPGIYTLYVRSIGSYFITQFILTVTLPSSGSGDQRAACCVTTIGERGLSYEQINDYRIGNRLLNQHTNDSPMKFNDYAEYVRFKMAQGSAKY
jgi:hypothetical protein